MIQEIKIYKLILNPMRRNTENGSIVAVSYEPQKLIDWYNSLLEIEGYVENDSPSFDCHGDSHNWHKVFKKGSTLEWYNPCDNFYQLNRHGHGISFEWITQDMLDRSNLNFIL